jgi:hypothetical protein
VRAAALTLALVLPAGRAGAQTGQALFSVDSAVSIDEFRGQNAPDRPNIVIDVTASLRLPGGWTMYVRPWFRQPRANSWDKEIYQAAVQYERSARVSTRVDAGYIVSPVGLGMMDTRPGVNPTILPHLIYVTPMPAFDAGAPRVQPIAATYPLGAQLTASTMKWDVRGAVLNAPTNRVFVLNAPNPNPSRRPFVAFGGGVTPKIGLRLGMSYAAGEYVKGSEMARPSDNGRSLRMMAVEGDYAFGYSRVTGEVTRDRLETGVGTETAYAWFVQGIHTLTPRVFLAGRQEGTSAPPLRTGIVPGVRTEMHITEATVGYRLSPDFTLRSSFYGRKQFTRKDWDQQVGFSLVWTHQWW